MIAATKAWKLFKNYSFFFVNATIILLKSLLLLIMILIFLFDYSSVFEIKFENKWREKKKDSPIDYETDS